MENDGASCFWDDPSATGSSVSPSDQSEWLRTTLSVEADKKFADNLLGGTMLSGISFQVTKLLHENLRQQAELLRRNKEKREEISKLRKQHPEEHQLIKPDICSIRHRQSLMRFAKVDAKRNRLKRFFSAGCSSFDTLI
ncbi:hypothetical protein ACFE04_023932 [Oxalis oulophora]